MKNKILPIFVSFRKLRSDPYVQMEKSKTRWKLMIPFSHVLVFGKNSKGRARARFQSCGWRQFWPIFDETTFQSENYQ